MQYESPLREEIRRVTLRAWVRRLWQDYDQINHGYLGGVLRPPTLEISASLTPLGLWNPATRTISISLRHIESDPWVAVIETLKHEVAHQYVDEALQHPDPVAHGDAWRHTCHRLGIEPRATASARGGRGPELASQSYDDDPRLRKIRKLLALGDNNPNEHEVRAALAQAQALMLRYNIDLSATKEDERTPVVRWVGKPSTRVEAHRYRVGSILDEFFFVRAVWVPSYLPDRDVSASQLELCGEQANVEMAEYIHDNLLRQLHSLWEQYRKEQGGLIKGLRARNSYFHGVLSGFASQLQRRRRRNQEQGLVWVPDARVQEVFRRRNPRVSHRSTGGYLYVGVSRDGERAGRDLRIARPLDGGGNGAVQGYLPSKR